MKKLQQNSKIIKKIHLTLILTFLGFSFLTAQTSFKKIISTYDWQWPQSIAEDNNGNFTIIANVKNNNNYYYNLKKINKHGDIIIDSLIDNKYLSSIKFYNNYYYVISSIGDSVYHVMPPYNTKIILSKLDTNLNLVSDDTLSFSSYRWISNQDFIIDNDSNIIIYGLSRWYYDTVWNILDAPFLYKVTLTGDSLIYKEPQICEVYDIIKKLNKKGYYALITDINNIEKLDESINLIQDTMLSDLKYNLTGAEINNDTLIIVGENPDHVVKTITIDTSFNIINTKNFLGVNICNKSFDCKNGNYFLFGLSSDTFKVYKLNPDLSTIWEKSIGGDANYDELASFILATNDGGCIIISSRFDPATQIAGQEYDIFIVKIAPDGSIQWKNDIKVNNDFKIYPNPGNNFINIQSDINYSQFIMFDISGKQVLNEQNNKQQINTTNLPNGVYIYKIIGKNNKTLKTGKWIKN